MSPMSDAQTIMKLRSVSGAGIVDCQKALDESGGDYEKGIELLRKRGQKVAAAKADRATHEGIIHAYIHGQGSVGVLVEVQCETDFVARNEEFKQFVHDVALHIAAANPLYLSSQDIPESVVEKEKEIYHEQIASEQKPDEIKQKIINGKLNKYYQETCLLNQFSIKDDTQTIQQLLTSLIGKLGENIQIKRFCRYTLS